MSHTVTVTRTTTTTTSAIILNTGYAKTWPGILKFLQLILGIINVGIVGHYYSRNLIYVPVTTMLVVAVTFMVGTFLILFSCLISISTASIISKTIYEAVYHFFAFIIYLIAGLILLVEVNRKKNTFYYYDYEPYLASAIIAIVIAVLYLLSTVFAWRSYKGL